MAENTEERELGLNSLFHNFYRYLDEGKYYLKYDDDGNSYADSNCYSMSRFESLRFIEKFAYGMRPYKVEEVQPHQANVNFGTLRYLVQQLVLPYQAVFTDSIPVDFEVDYDSFLNLNFSEKKLAELREATQTDPSKISNARISNELTDIFWTYLRKTSKLDKISKHLPYDIVMTGAGAVLHDCNNCLLYTSPSPRDKRQSRMPSSA